MPMQLIDRRRFLQLGLVAGAGAVAASVSRPGGAAAAGVAGAEARGDGVGQSAAPVATRQLVVIDMAGGNDGLSMVPPIGNGTYHDLRPRTALGILVLGAVLDPRRTGRLRQRPRPRRSDRRR